jgi:hypothetical protein
MPLWPLASTLPLEEVLLAFRSFLRRISRDTRVPAHPS